MVPILIFIAVIIVAAIAGWAVVGSAQALSRGRGDGPALESARRLDELNAAMTDLRAEVDQLASQQEADRQALEERLDFAERLLTRARDDAG